MRDSIALRKNNKRVVMHYYGMVLLVVLSRGLGFEREMFFFVMVTPPYENSNHLTVEVT